MSGAISVILDTDFLSAFLKIGHLGTLRDFYEVDYLLVPTAVYREISQTDLLPVLVTDPGIQVQISDHAVVRSLLQDEAILRLGLGEQEAIALAIGRKEAVLLTNDNKARKEAIRLGIQAIDIPTFLLACKLSRFLDLSNLSGIIAGLEERDRYKFRKEVRDLLLS